MLLCFADVHAELTCSDQRSSLSQSMLCWLSDDPQQGNKAKSKPRMLVIDVTKMWYSADEVS